jgi:hypothetical protein
MALHEATRFQYLKWNVIFNEEKPYQILSGRSEHTTISNTNVTFEDSAQDERVTDIREDPNSFSLDVNGFSAHKIDSKFSEWSDKERVESEYIPQVVEPFLRTHVDEATEIMVYDWHV